MIRIIIALCLAGMRIGGVDNDFFKDAAHLFVGGLLGAWMVEYRWNIYYPPVESKIRLNLFLAIVLSVIEVGCALYFKFLAA